MSAGVKLRKTQQANVFRFALELGHWSMQSVCLKSANKRHHALTSSVVDSNVAADQN
jgi:hypothetical protein